MLSAQYAHGNICQLSPQWNDIFYQEQTVVG